MVKLSFEHEKMADNFQNVQLSVVNTRNVHETIVNICILMYAIFPMLSINVKFLKNIGVHLYRYVQYNMYD